MRPASSPPTPVPQGPPLSPCHSPCLQTVFSFASLSPFLPLPSSLLCANGCFLFIKANFSGIFTVFNFLVGQARPGRVIQGKDSTETPGSRTASVNLGSVSGLARCAGIWVGSPVLREGPLPQSVGRSWELLQLDHLLEKALVL